MKQCPKCNFSCGDDEVVCKNCGYLFTPEGFERPTPENPANPAQNGYNNPSANNQQNGFNTPSQNPQQGYHPNAIPPQQQAQYQNEWQNNYNAPQNGMEEQKTNGFSIASLVLGIVGLVTSCCYAFGLLPGILGLVFGIVSLNGIKKSDGRQKGTGMSIAGLILSAIGILIAVFFIAFLIMNREQLLDYVQKYMQFYKDHDTGSSF